MAHRILLKDIQYAVDIIYNMSHDREYKDGWRKFQDDEHHRLVGNVASALVQVGQGLSPLVKISGERGQCSWKWIGPAPTKTFYETAFSHYRNWSRNKKNKRPENRERTIVNDKPYPSRKGSANSGSSRAENPLVSILRECKRLGIMSMELHNGKYEGWFCIDVDEL